MISILKTILKIFYTIEGATMYDTIKLTTVFKPYKDYLVIDNQSMVIQLLDKLYFLNEQIINENVKTKGA
jgi:hypothetical protein